MPFFSRIPVDKKAIEAAIIHLEQQTSAELRVYIERKIPHVDGFHHELDGYERALQVFQQLEMDCTQHHNAVLIYLAYKDHYCQIIGDKGIHQYVGEAFWRQVCNEMIHVFKQNRYTDGLIMGINRIGNELIVHFPIQPDDKNELANEVMIND